MKKLILILTVCGLIGAQSFAADEFAIGFGGELCITTNITGHKPLLSYFEHAEPADRLYAPAVLWAELPTTDGHTLVYDSAGKFTFAEVGSENWVIDFDDFVGSGTAFAGRGGWAVSTAGSGAFAIDNGEAGRPGIVLLSTASASSSSPSLSQANTAYLFGGGSLEFEAAINITTLSDGTETYTLKVGFLDSSAGAPADGAWLEYIHSANSGNWVAKTASNTGNTSSHNTSVAASTTWTKLKVAVAAGGGSVEFFIDGASVGTITSGTSIPITAGRYTGPRIALVKSNGSTARTVQVDWAKVKFRPTSPR